MGAEQFLLGALTMRNRERLRRAGFTLIELLIVVAIAAVLLALVAPSFTDMIAMQRLRGAHDQLATDVQFARAEAARLGVPVHVRVQPRSASGAACYIIFTDRGDAGSPYSFSLPACDCKQPAGSRCSAASTAELKTVTLETSTGLDLDPAGTPPLDRAGFDPATGTLFTPPSDRAIRPTDELVVDTLLDPARRMRLRVGRAGRVQVCAPSGSSVKAVAC